MIKFVRYEKNQRSDFIMHKLELGCERPLERRDVSRGFAMRIQRPESRMFVHCANSFPLISPSLYRAVKDEGRAEVQTLHKFSTDLPRVNAQMRDGRICEDCPLVKRLALSGIVIDVIKG